jgi:hypothetical protein
MYTQNKAKIDFRRRKEETFGSYEEIIASEGLKAVVISRVIVLLDLLIVLLP